MTDITRLEDYKTNQTNTVTVTNNDPTAIGSLADALDYITKWINRYSAHMSEHEARVMALWAAHTWVVMAFYVSPRIIFTSATKGSGKTRQLELLEQVSASPQPTLNSTPAVMFRSIEQGRENGQPPTILFDETDTIFTGNDTGNQVELKGIINGGYKKNGKVQRAQGDNFEVKTFSVFSPLALAGIAGNMPDTITSRSVVVEMRKRKASQMVEGYRERTAEVETRPVRAFFDQWSSDETVDSLRDRLDTVDLPAGVEDREAEVWEPLVCIADMAGGQWPTWAREACTYFLSRPSLEQRPRGVRLLEDIRTVMDGADSIRSMELCHRLNLLQESEWSGMTPEGIRAHDVARELRLFGVAPVKVYRNGKSFSGYTIGPTCQNGKDQVGLYDAWERHLDPVPSSRPGDSGDNGNGAGQDGSNPLPSKDALPPVEVMDHPDSVRGNGPGNEKTPGQGATDTDIRGITVSEQPDTDYGPILDQMTVGEGLPVKVIVTRTGKPHAEVRRLLEAARDAGEVTITGPLAKRLK